MRAWESNKITVLTKQEATMVKKPKYNAYAFGYGPHGKSKYDRNKTKRMRYDEGWY